MERIPGWGGSSLLLALFSSTPLAYLILPFSGLVSGFSGGAFVGWLTGLLVRHKSPPLVGRRLVLELDGRVVGLPLRAPIAEMPPVHDFPGGYFFMPSFKSQAAAE